MPRGMLQRRRGQAAVLAALCFVMLVAALGLALDGANAFGQRRLMSVVTDAAALAATRELIERRANSAAGTHINNTIENFLTNQHDLDAGAVTWQAFYVDRDARDSSLGQVQNGVGAPGDANGIRVELSYRFPTYFMGVFGRRELEVSGRATAVYGPLGTAVGQELAPLAVSNAGLDIIRSMGEDGKDAKIDLKNRLTSDWNDLVSLDPIDPDTGLPREFPEDVVSPSNFIHVSFANVNMVPTTGNHCGSSNPADNLTYWWCHGSPNMLQINRELPYTRSPDDVSRLDDAIDWREMHRKILVLPEYSEFGSSFTIASFLAVEIRSYDPSTGVLRVRFLEDYPSAGSMVGQGSGVNRGVLAVNLVR